MPGGVAMRMTHAIDTLNGIALKDKTVGSCVDAIEIETAEVSKRIQGMIEKLDAVLVEKQPELW